MREIKFKAWDKRQKQMSNTFTLVELTQYEHIFEVKFRNLARFNDLIWLQYTGLKDKNGKEIYEGDIVKFPYCRQEYILPVRWGTDGWWAKGLGWFKNLYWVQDKCEVIGNIYENPELIKEA